MPPILAPPNHKERPPSELLAFCDRDLLDVEALLAILEALPPERVAASPRAMEAATWLYSFGEWIKAQAARQADMFVPKASKRADPEFRKSDIQLLFYYVFADRLLLAAQAALDWLNWPTRHIERPRSWKMSPGDREIHFERLGLIGSALGLIESSAIGLARPIKHSTTALPARRLAMSRGPQARSAYTRQRLTS